MSQSLITRKVSDSLIYGRSDDTASPIPTVPSSLLHQGLFIDKLVNGLGEI